MRASLYIYYKADGNNLPISALSNDLMADIFIKTGIRGRLLQRRDDKQTWMEVYEPVHDCAAFQQAMQAALALRPTLAALQRHEEWFVPVTPPEHGPD